jgi:hypothetical protein
VTSSPPPGRRSRPAAPTGRGCEPPTTRRSSSASRATRRPARHRLALPRLPAGPQHRVLPAAHHLRPGHRRSDETPLTRSAPRQWRAMYDRGVQTNSRPVLLCPRAGTCSRPDSRQGLRAARALHEVAAGPRRRRRRARAPDSLPRRHQVARDHRCCTGRTEPLPTARRPGRIFAALPPPRNEQTAPVASAARSPDGPAAAQSRRIDALRFRRRARPGQREPCRSRRAVIAGSTTSRWSTAISGCRATSASTGACRPTQVTRAAFNYRHRRAVDRLDHHRQHVGGDRLSFSHDSRRGARWRHGPGGSSITNITGGFLNGEASRFGATNVRAHELGRPS